LIIHSVTGKSYVIIIKMVRYLYVLSILDAIYKKIYLRTIGIIPHFDIKKEERFSNVSKIALQFYSIMAIL